MIFSGVLCELQQLRYMKQYLSIYDLHIENYIFVCRKSKTNYTWLQI